MILIIIHIVCFKNIFYLVFKIICLFQVQLKKIRLDTFEGLTTVQVDDVARMGDEDDIVRMGDEEFTEAPKEVDIFDQIMKDHMPIPSQPKPTSVSFIIFIFN